MDCKTCAVLLLVITPLIIEAWKSSGEEIVQSRDLSRGGIHYHTKRHMLPLNESKVKKRTSPPKTRDTPRKKPSGHLTPLKEDDMDNDEVVSVAIGPPPIRPKYDKLPWKASSKTIRDNTRRTSNCSHSATTLVKDVLTQLGREFLTNQVNEDFVFGQYVGNAMRNLTSDLRLKMQHEILELVVRFQKLNRGEVVTIEERSNQNTTKELKIDKKMSVGCSNDTEDWPDFTNLAKIVG